jgi:DNA-binding IclR family transcriptional regulator
MAKLSRGERLCTADVATACGMTRQGAYRLLDTMSRVTPLLLDNGEWQLLRQLDGD